MEDTMAEDGKVIIDVAQRFALLHQDGTRTVFHVGQHLVEPDVAAHPYVQANLSGAVSIPQPGTPDFARAQRQRLKDALRKEIYDEVLSEVREQVEAELRAKLEAELLRPPGAESADNGGRKRPLPPEPS